MRLTNGKYYEIILDFSQNENRKEILKKLYEAEDYFQANRLYDYVFYVPYVLRPYLNEIDPELVKDANKGYYICIDDFWVASDTELELRLIVWPAKTPWAVIVLAGLIVLGIFVSGEFLIKRITELIWGREPKPIIVKKKVQTQHGTFEEEDVKIVPPSGLSGLGQVLPYLAIGLVVIGGIYLTISLIKK